ncbi:MAG TPA: glycoside hydrolase family 28 protein [Thermoanaerobaculia bacterium]
MRPDRSALLAAVFGGIGLLAVACASAPPSSVDPWTRAAAIVASIQPPSFPARTFPVGDYGARADGSDATPGLTAAIEACRRAGGGRVVVPAGTYRTGPLLLLSGVDLHLARGAVLLFDTDPARYLPVVATRWEGVDVMGLRPLVRAADAEDVAITGEGVLDGGAGPERWWPWKTASKPARDQLFKDAEAGVPPERRVYGVESFLRPSFFEPVRCRRVLVEGVTFKGAPFWVLHPVLSQDVTVRGVTVSSAGPNNDGCDPESCSGVLIEDSTFDTGDDCIALKSGRNADGRRVNVPVERVVVRRCRMRAGHGGVTIGSEVTGGARDVFVERCTMSSPDLERGIRIKSNAMRGGTVENVFVRDVEIGEVRTAVDVDLTYEEGAKGSFQPVVRNVRIERLTAAKAVRAFLLKAIPGAPISGLTVSGSAFRGLTEPSVVQGDVSLALENVTFDPPRFGPPPRS